MLCFWAIFIAAYKVAIGLQKKNTTKEVTEINLLKLWRLAGQEIRK